MSEKTKLFMLVSELGNVEYVSISRISAECVQEYLMDTNCCSIATIDDEVIDKIIQLRDKCLKTTK
jgi:rRNA-processing protein FCF1